MTLRSLTLRPLAEADLPEILAIDQAALGGLWNADGYGREIASSNSDLIGAFARDTTPTPDREVQEPSLMAIGCGWAIVDECHLTLLAVDPEVQRQGLGQAVLWGLLALARDRGLARATLEVRVSNLAARKLYDRFGFQTAGQRKRYYPDGEDAAILWRGQLDWPQFAQTLDHWHTEVSDRLLACGWQWLGFDRVDRPSNPQVHSGLNSGVGPADSVSSGDGVL